MSKKRLRKTYKPTAYILIGCFLMYILLSQAMAAFSRQDDIKKLENEISETENKITELDDLLATEEVYTNSMRSREIYEEKEALEEKLMTLYEEWESINL